MEDYLKNVNLVPKESFEKEFNKVLEKFSSSDNQTLIIPISGFSGVGKSTFIQKIKAISNENNIPFIIVRNDIFIGTESGSYERTNLLTSSWKNFRKLFYNQEKIKELVKKIIISKGKNVTIKDTYKRFDENKKPHGKFDGTESFTIPEEKFLIILDGVNSVEYAENLKGEGCDVNGFTIIDDPDESLLRATFRDANKKETNFEDIFEQRLNEYFYIQFWIQNNMKQSTTVITEDLSDVTKGLIKKYAETNDLSTAEIKQKINTIANQFKEKKVAKYPSKYAKFPNDLVNNLINKEL